jgi:hypothetical protein
MVHRGRESKKPHKKYCQTSFPEARVFFVKIMPFFRVEAVLNILNILPPAG